MAKLTSITEIVGAIADSNIEPNKKADAVWYINGLLLILAEHLSDLEFGYDERKERYWLGEEGNYISNDLGRFLDIYWSN